MFLKLFIVNPTLLAAVVDGLGAGAVPGVGAVGLGAAGCVFTLLGGIADVLAAGGIADVLAAGGVAGGAACLAGVCGTTGVGAV